MIRAIIKMKIIKKFKSKKNNVYLVEIQSKRFIKKVFADKHMYVKERNFYLNVQPTFECMLPKLLRYEDTCNELIIEYIAGKSVLNLVEEYEMLLEYDLAFSVVKKIILWLEQFSKLDYVAKNRLCFHDVNFRNFIIYDGNIYGIDFEDVQQGSIKQDIVKVIAMYLCYRPEFSEFKVEIRNRLTRFLIDKGWFDKDCLNEYIAKEYDTIKKRRLHYHSCKS